jgi:hypothetical protein
MYIILYHKNHYIIVCIRHAMWPPAQCWLQLAPNSGRCTTSAKGIPPALRQHAHSQTSCDSSYDPKTNGPTWRQTALQPMPGYVMIVNPTPTVFGIQEQQVEVQMCKVLKVHLIQILKYVSVQKVSCDTTANPSSQHSIRSTFSRLS